MKFKIDWIKRKTEIKNQVIDEFDDLSENLNSFKERQLEFQKMLAEQQQILKRAM